MQSSRKHSDLGRCSHSIFGTIMSLPVISLSRAGSFLMNEPRIVQNFTYIRSTWWQNVPKYKTFLYLIARQYRQFSKLVLHVAFISIIIEIHGKLNTKCFEILCTKSFVCWT